jgi:hypothetical protein
VRRFLLSTAGLCLASLLGLGAAARAEPPGKPDVLDKFLDKKGKDKDGCKEGCGRYSTKIDFYKTPQEAAKAAVKEEKLVFVLHLSGIFEKQEFT